MYKHTQQCPEQNLNRSADAKKICTKKNNHSVTLNYDVSRKKISVHLNFVQKSLHNESLTKRRSKH